MSCNCNAPMPYEWFRTHRCPVHDIEDDEPWESDGFGCPFCGDHRRTPAEPIGPAYRDAAWFRCVRCRTTYFEETSERHEAHPCDPAYPTTPQ